MGKDFTLFSLVDGKVKFERLDAKRQKVSVYPEEA
jgi:large subunit ribosomal protein L27